MKAPKYIEKNPCNEKILSYNRSKHLKTLQEIQASKSRMIDCSTPQTYNKIKLKKPKKHYLEELKVQEIFRENQNLLDRLLNLSDKAKKYSKESSEYSKSVPRSMNSYVRKMVQVKIENENKGIANRLSAITPSMNRNEFKKDFQNHVRLLSIVSKFDSDLKSGKKKKGDSLDPIKKAEISHSPSFCRNPYLKEDGEVVRKEWRVANLERSPSGNYLMAIPIAVYP